MRDSNPGSFALEVDASPLGQRGGVWKRRPHSRSRQAVLGYNKLAAVRALPATHCASSTLSRGSARTIQTVSKALFESHNRCAFRYSFSLSGILLYRRSAAAIANSSTQNTAFDQTFSTFLKDKRINLYSHLRHTATCVVAILKRLRERERERERERGRQKDKDRQKQTHKHV